MLNVDSNGRYEVFSVEDTVTGILVEYFGDEVYDMMLKYGKFYTEYCPQSMLYYIGYKRVVKDVGQDFTALTLSNEKIGKLISGERFGIDSKYFDELLWKGYTNEF